MSSRPRTMEMFPQAALGPAAQSLRDRTTSNPMIDRRGPGPTGMTCRNCVHLLSFYDGKLHGCRLRTGDDAPSSNQQHYTGWDACDAYESDEQSQ